MTFLLTTFAILKRLPWWVYVGAICAAALLWLVADDRHYRAKADALTLTLSQVKDAQTKATIAAQAAHDAQEQQSKDYARVQQELQQARSKPVSDATDGYAAANRVPVCPAAVSAARPTPTTSKDSSASVPASVPADTLVAISDVDLHKCAALAVYSVSAHDWAAGLNP